MTNPVDNMFDVTTSADTSGFFVKRFYNDTDGLPPYDNSDSIALAGFKIQIAGRFSSTCVQSADADTDGDGDGDCGAGAAEEEEVQEEAQARRLRQEVQEAEAALALAR